MTTAASMLSVHVHFISTGKYYQCLFSRQNNCSTMDLHLKPAGDAFNKCRTGCPSYEDSLSTSLPDMHSFGHQEEEVVVFFLPRTCKQGGSMNHNVSSMRSRLGVVGLVTRELLGAEGPVSFQLTLTQYPKSGSILGGVGGRKSSRIVVSVK